MTTTTRSPERTQLLLDILTTACEGGIGYWSTIESYDIWDDYDAGVQKLDPQLVLFEHAEEGDEGAEFVCTQRDIFGARDVWGIRYELNVDTIAKGMRLAMEDESLRKTIRKTLMNAQFDNDMMPEGCEDIDAGVADLVVQYGLFGTAVYG